MSRVGYARVSATDHALDIQITKLKDAGGEIVRSETGSGASRDNRTELETVLQFVREGDELVVHRLDRLVALQHSQRNFRLECRAVVPSWSSCHLRSFVLARCRIRNEKFT